MADASALVGLLDRASHVFGLVGELGREFQRECHEQSPVNMIWPGEESPRQRHLGRCQEFIAALQELRDAIKNPPAGFAGVADVLRRAANTAKLMASSPHWEPLESWPHLNQHAHDGYLAIKAARAAMPQDDQWDFSESAPAPAPEPDDVDNRLGGFAARLKFPDSPEDRAIVAEYEANFKRETGWDFPKTDLAWREVFAAAGFTPAEEREIRTKHADESEIAEYYTRPGHALMTTIMARLPRRKPAGESKPSGKVKRSTERGEGRVKLIAALTKHHQYADGGCLNLAPIGNNELARVASVSDSTASAFFNREFNGGEGGGHKKYRVTCGDSVRLVAALKLLNQEYSPHHLFDAKPRCEGDRDDE